ncbi:FAD-dependent oxidoreductase [Thermococcus sp.]|uniref:FAD-dependent oxidoreductase n=1 Tax=Thermococcus sp. TaxID=35749 RepID=UPI00260505F0|nr:FAD-dependent oxidoreductase [Thermococcus sp.]
MMRTDVLIVGGGAAGIVAALTAKGSYPDKDVTMVRKEEKTLVPCGIPYIFGTLGSVEKDVISDDILKKSGINLVIDKITSVDLKEKAAETRNGERITFEKLILATGSKPLMPPINGADKENVFQVKKDFRYLSTMKERIKESQDIVIIGGGFIGVEFADELRKLGKDVSIVEMLPHVLYNSFDDEFCEMAEAELGGMGVGVYTNTRVKEITGKRSAEGVALSNGKNLNADLVIVAAGVRPNTELAERMGLKVSKYGIEVDEYMRTSHPDIFAVGDCAEKRDFFTRKPKLTLLASVATAEARIAGANLYRIKAFKQFRGTLGIFATKVGNLSLGAAGLIERSAKAEGFEYVVGRSNVSDKHPASLPEASEVSAKLIFTKQGGFFIGGQLAGGKTIGEMINLIGFAIESGYTASQYIGLQIGTHPLLTPAPTAPATIKAVEDALRQIYH